MYFILLTNEKFVYYTWNYDLFLKALNREKSAEKAVVTGVREDETEAAYLVEEMAGREIGAKWLMCEGDLL